MKVVALVSGGKDSCYNMLLCQKYGHEIVALANLLPAEAAVDELDSFMFQTVGHQLVAAYAECTGIPLFRRRIKGTSKNTELRYAPTAHDEVEDLALLLEHIKRVMPDLQAVSSGAIASDYQRLRVESVCARLGLVSLAYLWKQPQDQLLQDMIDAGIHAVIVKVAALGLSPERHLGLSLEEIQATMHSLAAKFGVNVCGEGGEFETLTLDCPLFKHGVIVLDSWHPVLVSPDAGGAPVGHMKVESFHVERKGELAAGTPSAAALEPIDVPDSPESPQATGQSEHEQCSLLPPPPAQREGEVVHRASAQPAQSQTVSSLCQVRIHAQPEGSDLILIGCRWRGAGDGEAGAASSNQVQTAELGSQANGAVTVGLQGGAMLHAVRMSLGERGLTWNNALYIRLYVADMAQFAEANKAYSSAIPDSECPLGVPSRATVETPFPSGPARVALDVLACRGQGAIGPSTNPHAATSKNLPYASGAGAKLDKEVLHVRSISCWAPSCIGPYSQCTRYRNLLFMAGQLGLDPPLMELITPQARGPEQPTAADVAAAEMQRALMSCQAVAEAMRGSVRALSLTLTVYCSPLVGATEMEAVRAELDAFLRGPKGGLSSELHQDSVTNESECVAERDHLRRAYDWTSDLTAGPAGKSAGSIKPCVLFLSVPALPKGAAVEVAPVVYLPDASAAWDGEPPAVPSAFSFNEQSIESVQPLGKKTGAVGSNPGTEQSAAGGPEPRGGGVEPDLQHLSLASRFTARNESEGTGHAGSVAPTSSGASDAFAASAAAASRGTAAASAAATEPGTASATSAASAAGTAAATAAAIPPGLHLVVRGHADEGALCSCHIWLYADEDAVLPLHPATSGVVAEALMGAFARSLRIAMLRWSDVLELRIHLPSQEHLLVGLETEIAKQISSLEMTISVYPITALVSGLHLPHPSKGDVVVLAHAQLSAVRFLGN